MSVRIIGDIFHLPLSCQSKLVLLALANYANDDGYCWPTQASLSSDTSLSQRRLRDHLHALTLDGWVRIMALGNGRGKSTQYLLNVELIALKAGGRSPKRALGKRAEKADPLSQKADDPDGKGGQPTSDQPSLTVNDPSRAAAARANERVRDDLSAIVEATAAWADATGKKATRQITAAMKRWIERDGLERVIDAIRETGRNSSRAWSYTEAILERWERDGCKPKGQLEPGQASNWTGVNDLDARRLRGEDISADVAANRAAADAELERQMTPHLTRRS